MKLPSIICIAALLVFHSCTDSQKENNLNTREQELIIKEKEFAAKEAEFQELIAMRDSLKNANDSSAAKNLPQNIPGKWTGKMICIESSCAEHAIGDQRNDVWEFSENGNTVLAKVTNRTGNEKIYTGNYTGTELRLNSDSDSTSVGKTQINIVLNDLQKTMKGTRYTTGGNGCTVKFSLELEKIKN